MGDQGVDALATSVDAKVHVGAPAHTNVFEDVTEAFLGARKEMKTGEMIHTPTFRLEEAMTALEMGDPKMDAGLGAVRSLTAAEAVEVGALSLAPPRAHVVAILDHLLCLEAMWQQGALLVSTVFTCRYLHLPERIEGAELRACVYSLVKCIDLARTCAIDAHTHAEEDFLPNTFGFSLCEDIKDADVVSMCTEVEQALEKEQSALRKRGDAHSREAAECAALLYRVRLRRSLQNVHMAFARDQGKGIKAAVRAIKFAMAQIALVRETASVAADVDVMALGVFDANINRALVSSMPPRKVVQSKLGDALASVASQLEHLLVLTGLPRATTLLEQLDFLSRFSTLRPGVVARARCMRLWHHNNLVLGKHHLYDMVRESLVAFGVDSKLYKKSAREIAEATSDEDARDEVARYTDSVARTVFQLAKLWCQNRTRVHRKTPFVLQDWAILQSDARVLDARYSVPRAQLPPHAKPGTPLPHNPHAFTGWVLAVTSKLLCEHTGLGVELDLFSTSELPHALWYGSYLWETRVSLYTYVRKWSAKALPLWTSHAQLPMWTVQSMLYDALWRIAVAAQAQNRFPRGTDALLCAQEDRFHHRFRPYYLVPQPEPRYFEDWSMRLAELSGTAPARILVEAIVVLRNAKQLVDKLKQWSPAPPEHMAATVAHLAEAVAAALQTATQLMTSPTESTQLTLEPCGAPMWLLRATLRAA